MHIDFDELKKEFEAFKSNKEQCELEECGEDSGFIEQIQKEMLAPAKCGVYFSRLDIKVIGLMIGEDVQVRERKRMVRDILRSITTKEGFQNFIDAVDEVAQSKIKIYDELSIHFPSSKPIFTQKKERYNRFQKILSNILEEFEEVE